MENTGFKPERVFLILCLFWGFVYLFVSPPFTAADECCHFWKIYLISKGTISAKKLTSYVVNGEKKDKVSSMTGDYMPLGMYKAGYKNLRTKWNYNEKTNLSETKEILSYQLEKNKMVFNAFVVPAYTIFSYLPSVVLMKIMTLANINPGVMMYVLRLVSLVTYTALIYAAIKIMPFKKWLFASLALLPTAVYQASMINTDGITIGTGFLFIAFTLYYAFGKNTGVIGKKQLVIYLGIGLWFLVCKFAYAPVLLIYFLIPKEKFESEKLRYKAFGLTVVILFLFVLLLFCLNSIVVSYTDFYYFRYTAFALLIHKPLIFFKALLYTVIVKGRDFFTGVIGSFGWGELKVPFYSASLYYFSLILFSLFNFKEDENEKIIGLKDKILFLFIFVSYFFLLFVLLFLNFQISQDGIIAGFWGRYFIPVLPLLFLCLQNKKFFVKTNTLMFVNLFFINFVLFVSLIRILYRFYV